MLPYAIAAFSVLALLAAPAFGEESSMRDQAAPSEVITMFMSGDVMTGRGIDQVLSHPSDPKIYEPVMKSARGYVELAEKANGPIPKPVGCNYIWGDALEELERVKPDLRIINLETSVTKSKDYWESKQIHYRMHPKNVSCLETIKIDFCSLANNHILDWGYKGLEETLEALKSVGIKSAGAGADLRHAEAPAVIEVEGKGRVIVFSYGLETAGIGMNWDARPERPGVNLLKDLSSRTIRHISEKVAEARQAGDIVVVSIHWGSNWGHDISSAQIDFAHKLIDTAGVDVIHGHSSHHVKAIEAYKRKLVLYGCGDLLNDYEGIRGHEEYRDDLGLMYFVSLDPSTGQLVRLEMTPTQVRRFRVNRADSAGARWLRDTLNREGKKFGTRVEFKKDGRLMLQWD